MDNDHRTRLDRQPDTVEGSRPVQLIPAERQRRLAEAREFARRAKNDPRESTLLDQIEALQADNPIP